MKYAITHSGAFHSDDVFATAFLLRMFENIEVKRVTYLEKIDESKSKETIVYDIGGGIFDHHQKGGNGERKNGIPYSSFGLLWKRYGFDYLRKINVQEDSIRNIFYEIDKNLVSGIDGVDNGYFGKYRDIMTVVNAISLFKPTWDSDEDFDSAFFKAVDFAGIIFDNLVKKVIADEKAQSIVEEKIQNSKDQILVLDKFVSWQKALFKSQNENAQKILFVIYPSNREGYNVSTVPKGDFTFSSRLSFPTSWWGENGSKLEEKCNVKGATFVHAKGFIAGAETQESAILLAQSAIEANLKEV